MKLSNGHALFELPLPPGAHELALKADWAALDRLMGEAVQTMLRPRLLSFKNFTHIEHMLALRDASDPEEEDGIWHDDGSRVLAFSWSLNVFGEIQGGTLGLRPKGESALELGPYPAGTVLVFQTGMDGFEHRTARVTQGKRLVCAGWCS
jgi:hypothetical protein